MPQVNRDLVEFGEVEPGSTVQECMCQGFLANRRTLEDAFELFFFIHSPEYPQCCTPPPPWASTAAPGQCWTPVHTSWSTASHTMSQRCILCGTSCEYS